MEAMVAWSVVSAMAGSEGRSVSMRFNISEEKCCTRLVLMPSPQASIFPSLKRHCTIADAACSMLGPSSSFVALKSFTDSSKIESMRVFIGVYVSDSYALASYVLGS